MTGTRPSWSDRCGQAASCAPDERTLRPGFGPLRRSVSDIDYAQFAPELRKFARILPKGYALHRGLARPRSLMAVAGWAARVRRVEVATINSHVAARVHRPAAPQAPVPALLWVHGGGTVMGNAAQDDRFCRKLVDFTDVAVVAVEHRLAPEHPYLVPVEDCYAALTWLAAQPWVDPTRMAIGGASAGGGFTADGDQPRVMWSASDNQLAWQWYLGGADPATAVPARRADLTGLPAAWIGVGSRDLFYDECRTYAERLRDSGVPVHEHVAVGAFHAFDLIAPKASVSQRFFAGRCRAIRSALVETSR